MQESAAPKPPRGGCYTEALRTSVGVDQLRCSRVSRGWLALLGACLVAFPAGGAPATPAAPVRYRGAAAVAAVFHSRCVGCHGADESSGGLRLDSYDALMRGGERGPVVVPSNARASLLLRKVTRRDKPFMPPRRALSSAEVRTIWRWIDAGAPPW